MIKTAHNPCYRCSNCNTLFRSEYISVVVTPDLELPACPECKGTLKIESILASLMEEPVYDASIAKAIRQNFGAAYTQAMRDSVKDFIKQIK